MPVVMPRNIHLGQSTLWQRHREARAFAFTALNFDASIVRKHDLLNQREAEAGALTLRRIERDKHFRDHFAGHSPLIVLDQDLDVASFIEGIDGHGYDSPC